ncbi:MAG: nucleotide sugar dehydrogenase [Methanospirillaceae archaeon]|nr:nucleotide sugar dehydrogenase [Methanospirillaceae archaeon]
MIDLTHKIKDHSACIGIIGLGYVGLPLSLAFAQKFQVIGYDIDPALISGLLQGHSHISDISDENVRETLGVSFHPTDKVSDLKEADFIIICVPTPLDQEKIPDLTFIKNACIAIASFLRPGTFVILESTTYPGTTLEVVRPILETSGYHTGKDFGLAYSPERIDPGNKSFSVSDIPKVVGGIDTSCSRVAASLYGSIINDIITVSDTTTAESVKMVENIFRNVNIALVNELSLIFEQMGVNIWEIIDAAATKPYGFMPFYPGPGIGGHCIPLDPYYMSYKAKKYGFIPQFIEKSGEINEFMPFHVVNLIERGLRQVHQPIMGSIIAVLGLTYKRDLNDTRETPACEVIDELDRLGAHVRVYDPYIKELQTRHGIYRSGTTLQETLTGADCAVFLVDHEGFCSLDLGSLGKMLKKPVVIDCKNIFSGSIPDMIYLGLGKGETISGLR